MKNFSKAILLFFSPIDLIASNENNFHQLIIQNAISLKATSLGGYAGKTLSVAVTNNNSSAQTFTVPAGIIFDSKNNTEQDLLVVEEQLVYMPAKTKRNLLLNTVCCQAYNSGPSNGSGFNYKGMAKESLKKIAQFISDNKLQGDDAQHAVWVLSDKSPIESISLIDKEKSEKLIKYLCDNYKMSPPKYQVAYSGGGNAAFSGIPVKIKSKMSFEIQKQGHATLLIQDALGHNYVILWEDKFQKVGNYEKEYAFRTKDLKPGTYFARLFFDHKLLKEQEISF